MLLPALTAPTAGFPRPTASSCHDVAVVSAYQPHDPTDVGLKRMVSAVIDVGIAYVIYFALFAVLSKPNVVVFNSFSSSNDCGGAGLCNTVGSRHISGGTAALVWFIFWAYMVGVFVLQRGITGKTLGTMAMGIVTVNGQGRPIGVGYALLRSVAGIVDYIPCCIPLVGIVTIFASKGHRRVGDMAGQSYVVEKAYAGQPVVIPGSNVGGRGPYAQPYGAQPAVRRARCRPVPAPAAVPRSAPVPGAAPVPGSAAGPVPAASAGYAAPPQPQYPTQPQYESPAPAARPVRAGHRVARPCHRGPGHAGRRLGLGSPRRHRCAPGHAARPGRSRRRRRPPTSPLRGRARDRRAAGR